MSHLAYIVIDGKPYRWKAILALRRLQRAANGKPATQQPLFASLYDDSRPSTARTASGRYQQPSLFKAEL